MNKISRYGVKVTSAQFSSLIRSIFEDPFEISEEFAEHSECRCELGKKLI